MTTPVPTDELRELIEAELVGPDLADLVRQLAAAPGARTAAAPLAADARERVRAGGLGALSDRELRDLLAAPESLYALQKDVLAAGGPYWDGVIGNLFTGPAAETPPPAPAPRPWYRAPAAWVTTAVAGLAGAVAVVLLTRGPDPSVDARLREQAAELAALRREVEALRTTPVVRESDRGVPAGSLAHLDPVDLPESDPADLPN